MTGATTPEQTCQQADCIAPALVCDECRRACALKWFGGISRHPESGLGCLLCEDGPPSWCGDHFVWAVASYREQLRTETGRFIGHWPDYPDLATMYPTLSVDPDGRLTVVRTTLDPGQPK